MMLESASLARAPFGLYIHIPYCIHKCPYCDFNSYAVTTSNDRGRSRQLREIDYTTALTTELAFFAQQEDWHGRRVQTVFFGGGTPSLFEAASIAKVLNRSATSFSLTDDVEVTLEANPGTLREELSLQKLSDLRAAGVNRISLGVQSFSPNKLAFLGRIHNADDVPRAVELIHRAGFTRLNLDLMFGTEAEQLTDWHSDISSAIALRPTHISAYALTIEPGTEFGNRLRHNTLPLPDEDQQAEFYKATQDILSAAGYQQYEISNFALPGEECRHNLGYWQGYDYLGIGAGSHSFVKNTIGQAPPQAVGRRWSNIPGPEDYIRRAQLQGDASQNREQIDIATFEVEFFFLRLRTAVGFCEQEYEQLFPALFQARFGEVCARLQADGLLRKVQERWQLTSRGFLFANTVMEEFARQTAEPF